MASWLRRDAGSVLGVVSGHLTLTVWGLSLVAPPENVSLLSLPAGFLLGCLAVLPFRLWPWILAALVPSALGLELALTDRSASAVGILLAANLLQAAGGAALLRRVGAERGFRDFRQLGIFLLGCLILLPGIAAAIGAWGVTLHEPAVPVVLAYRTLWMSAALGILVLAPLVLYAHARFLRWRAGGGLGLTLEHLGLPLAAVAVAALSTIVPPVFAMPPVVVLLLSPLLIVAAIRLDMLGTLLVSSSAVLVLGHLATADAGPSLDGAPGTSAAVLRLQGYLASANVAAMFAALAIERSREARRNLLGSLRRYVALFHQSPVSLWEEDLSAIKTYLAEAYVGPPEDLAAWLEAHPEHLAECMARIRVRRVNARTLELFDAPSTEALIGRGSRLFEARSKRVFGEAVAAFSNGARAFRGEVEHRTLSGRVLQTLTNVALAPGAEDDWSRVLVAIEDVTDRREARRALRHAHKMEAVGQMSGGVAHDFNNILAIVVGNLELLEAEGVLSELGRDCVRTSLQATGRAAALTRQLLGFSRQHPPLEAVLDANEAVRSIATLIERSITPAITVEYRLAQALLPVRVDRGDLEDALLNLVLNARDAMPDGGTLTFETRALTAEDPKGPAPVCGADGSCVELSITDTGVGMSPELRERAFEAYFTTKAPGKGTGLGLSMVYAFVRRSGGHVEVESEVGRGTRVRVFLPQQAPPTRVLAPPAARSPAAGEGTVLVVDDEPLLLQTAARLLTRLGYDVVTASDGREALDRLAEGGVDALVTDVVMPGGMDGYQLADRAAEAHPGLGVLLTSGLAGSAPREAPYPLLPKPYTMAQLAEGLRGVLEGPADSAMASGRRRRIDRPLDDEASAVGA
jgi:signal transduction histidine kinase/integral membrane sensor domain MASE1